jgi:hypothetical protein
MLITAADFYARGRKRQAREHRDAVMTPGLADPDRLVPERFGALRHLDEERTRQRLAAHYHSNSRCL